MNDHHSVHSRFAVLHLKTEDTVLFTNYKYVVCGKSVVLSILYIIYSIIKSYIYIHFNSNGN